MLILMWFLFLGPQTTPIQVSNPMEPGPYRIVFEENLRFGGGSQAQNMWVDGNISAFFAVDLRGHMFICDVKGVAIQEFDESGTFVKTFAARGEAPGEYQNIVALHILGDGTMIGQDSLRAVSKFTFYDDKGKVLNAQSINDASKIFRRTVYAPSGKIFFSGFMSREEATRTITYKTGFFDAEFQLVELVSQTPLARPSGPPRIDDPDWWVENLAGQMNEYLDRGSIFAKFLPDGGILIVRRRDYEIEKWDPGMKARQAIIKKIYQPITFRDEDKIALTEYLQESIFEQFPQLTGILTANVLERAIAKADLPLTQVPIADILPMEEGQFLTVHEASLKTGMVGGHIFDSEGKCIGSYRFPGKGVYDLFGTRITFKNGYAYAMQRNEAEENQLVRYTYKLEKD